MFATKWIRRNIFLQVKSKLNAPATTAQYFEVQVVKRIEDLTTRYQTARAIISISVLRDWLNHNQTSWSEITSALLPKDDSRQVVRYIFDLNTISHKLLLQYL